jgi:hypothetical protein
MHREPREHGTGSLGDHSIASALNLPGQLRAIRLVM